MQVLLVFGCLLRCIKDFVAVVVLAKLHHHQRLDRKNSTQAVSWTRDEGSAFDLNL